MMKKDITVLISVKNEQNYIGATIESILAQTYRNFDLWIIDDGSTDNTWTVIKSFKDPRIKAVRFKENSGMTQRLNWAVPQIKTEFIARMDSHHLAKKTRLKEQRDFMLAHPNVYALGSNYIRSNDKGQRLLESNYPTTYIGIKRKLLEKNIFRHASMFFKKDVYRKIGLYDPYFKVAQDYDFMLRLAAKLPVANLKDKLITEIYRKENMTQKHRVRSAWEALTAQWNGLTKYGYPFYQSIYLLRGVAFLLKSWFNQNSWLILLLFWAAVLRFWKVVPYFDFSIEANHMLYSISDFITGNQSRLLGVEAINHIHHLFLTPWYFLVAAPILMLAKGEPLVFAYLHPLIGVLSVFFLIKIGFVLNRPKMGALAAFIFAVWAQEIRVDRQFINVSLAPFAVILSILLLSLGQTKKDKKWFLFLGIWLGFSLSFHYELMGLIFAILAFVWWKSKKMIPFVLVPVILSFTPLIFFDLRNQFFNTVGVWYATVAILKGHQPYSTWHYFYMFYPLVILVVAFILSKMNRKIVFIILGLFAVCQIINFFGNTPGANYVARSQLANKILSYYDDGLAVQFTGPDSYNMRYILFLRAKQQGKDPNKIIVLEPWDFGERAKIVVSRNEVFLK